MSIGGDPGREPERDEVLDQLRALDVEFELVPCDPALADTAAFCEAYGYPVEDSVNTIIVVGKSEPRCYAACAALATTRIDVNGVVRKRLGTKKASFASADETVDLTGMAIGGVTPFALPDLALWIDPRVLDRERIIIGGGGRDRKLVLHPSALLELPRAEVVDDLAR